MKPVFPLALIALLPNLVQAGDEYIKFTGSAVDADQGSALYTENYFLHLIDGKLHERVVVYTCPGHGDTAFARKVVTVSDPFKPTFQLTDQRRGYLEGFDAANRTISFRPGATAELQTATAEDAPNMVVDSGFDEFVLKHWDELVAGEKLPIDFVVPSEQEALGFKIKHLSSETIAGRPAEVFRLALTGLLGLIADGIDVSYDKENKTLLRFAGLSNLRDEDGDNYTVTIDFPPSARESLTDDSALTAAKAQTLVSVCP